MILEGVWGLRFGAFSGWSLGPLGFRGDPCDLLKGLTSIFMGVPTGALILSQPVPELTSLQHASSGSFCRV